MLISGTARGLVGAVGGGTTGAVVFACSVFFFSSGFLAVTTGFFTD